MFNLKHDLETARRLQEQKFQHGWLYANQKSCVIWNVALELPISELRSYILHPIGLWTWKTEGIRTNFDNNTIFSLLISFHDIERLKLTNFSKMHVKKI